MRLALLSVRATKRLLQVYRVVTPRQQRINHLQNGNTSRLAESAWKHSNLWLQGLSKFFACVLSLLCSELARGVLEDLHQA